jgi:tetratricopeptide (TPR) repeat protein
MDNCKRENDGGFKFVTTSGNFSHPVAPIIIQKRRLLINIRKRPLLTIQNHCVGLEFCILYLMRYFLMIRLPKLLFIFAILSSLSSRADQAEDWLKESKLKLPLLKGEKKADLLAKIAAKYIHSLIIRSDSGLVYVSQAFKLYEYLGYKRGICNTAGLYGKVLLQLSRPDEAIYYYRLTASLAKELGDSTGEARGVRGIGQALWYQGNAQAAVDTIQLAINYFRKLGIRNEISDATLTISSIHGEQGDYEAAFESAQLALTYSHSYDDRPNIILSLLQLGKLYRRIGDLSTARDYFKQAENFPPVVGEWAYRHLAHNMGDLYIDYGRYDSALYYYRKSFSGNASSPMSKLKIGEFYLLIKNFDSSYHYFQQIYNLGDQGEGNIRFMAMLGLANIYSYRKDYQIALGLGREVMAKARTQSSKLIMRDAAGLLATIYDSLHQPELALDYYQQFVQLKEAIVNQQFKGRLHEFKRIADDEKKSSQIELLNKEKQITAQNLKKTRYLRNILAIAVIFIIVLGVIIFWNISLKRKNEKLRNESSKAEWQKAASDLEMQALRAQMNPHFIFNCLSSINRFILKNEPDLASDYLTKFSRLIRMVLINSEKSLILLEEEMEMLRLYLEMEKLRFKDKLTYSFTYAAEVKPHEITVPPMLLQPFCENAIWHGLMHKNGPGHLAVVFRMINDVLLCTITDNGIGRKKAAQIKPHSAEHAKSLGLKLTAERLSLFNDDNLVTTSLAIDDVVDENGEVSGTQVQLSIRCNDSV